MSKRRDRDHHDDTRAVGPRVQGDRGTERDSNAPVIEIRRVPNPMLTEELIQAIDSGEVSVPKTVGAAVNLSMLIGGFARVGGRTKARTEAAALYRASWEDGQIGGARAIDYAVPRVDTSIVSAAAVLEGGAGARLHYSRAVRRLGMLNSRLVELVVCEGHSLREVARQLGYGDSRSKREDLRKQLLAAIDMLVEEFRVAAPAARRVVGEGERPGDSSTDVVIRRKACAA